MALGEAHAASVPYIEEVRTQRNEEIVKKFEAKQITEEEYHTQLDASDRQYDEDEIRHDDMRKQMDARHTEYVSAFRASDILWKNVLDIEMEKVRKEMTLNDVSENLMFYSDVYRDYLKERLKRLCIP